MIFELMSRGNIVELPKTPGIIDSYDPENVILLLPYNRYLHGRIQNGYESWKLCKIGNTEQEEIYLYDGEARHFDFDSRQVVISQEVVDKLKSTLLASSSPPGEHIRTAAVLKGILEPDIVDNELFIYDESFAMARLDNKTEAKAAYWAVRLALSRGDHDSVSRIKLWYRIAPNIAFSEPIVLVWFSLTQVPDSEAVASMTSLGISEENIHRMAAQAVSPVVLFSQKGYLIFASYGDGQRTPIFREWAYFPLSVWNDLRDRKRITLRELLTAAWGAEDARQAWKVGSRYNNGAMHNAQFTMHN
ncbi:MAG: hypothetical protein FWE49_01620 [Synergistaceae bacterium]|nr:hypothetical protein [Synergistaceae bacterium]